MKMKKLLMMTLACSLFAATPILAAPASGNDGGPQVIQYADLDQSLTAAADKAIEQHRNGKIFKLEEASKDVYYVDKNIKERWLMQDKDRSAVISVDAISGKVLTVSLTFNIAEVTGDYASYLKVAQSAVKQLNGKSDLVFTEAYYYQDNIGGRYLETMTFNTEDDQFITVDMKTSQPTGYRLKYKVADVDRKITAVAEQAVTSMGISKVQPFTDIQRYKFENIDEWRLGRRVEVKGDLSKYGAVERDADGRMFVVEASVTIVGKTGKLISVTIKPKTDNQKTKSLTDKQSIALAKPVAKKLFGVDLTSYTLKVNKEWKDYTFSSKGKESIVANFDTFGNLVRMERKLK